MADQNGHTDPAAAWACTCCGSSAIAQDAAVEANGGHILAVYDAMQCTDCGSTSVELPGGIRSAGPGAADRGEYLLQRVAAVAGDALWCRDIGPALTCDEAEVFADVLRHAGDHAAADRFLDAHAESDEPGDLHQDRAAGYTADPAPAQTDNPRERQGPAR